MKVRLSEIPVGSCYVQGRKGETKKKVSDGKVASIGKTGKVSTRKMRGDPEVEPSTCPLRYLGVGLRRHPDQVVEIGSTQPPKRMQRPEKNR